MKKIDSIDLLTAAEALDYALRRGLHDDNHKVQYAAWEVRHTLVEVAKNLAAFELLNFRPKVLLQMKRARDLLVGDVIVGRVGGAWRIVTGVEIIADRPEGHVRIDYMYEGGIHWGPGHNTVTCQHYLFVVKP